ncbi:MAG: hypothetical protein RIM84_03275 [Alphaproteobacteria bacterium]
MVPIFNISSTGASATAWLTKLLNRHPSIVCLHALREDPFDDNREIEPADMVKGLLDLCYRTKELRCFGVIHSYYDTKVYDAVKAGHGGFMAIVRHPVNRIHSLFNHHYREISGHTVRDGDIYGTIVADGAVRDFLPMFETRVTDTLYADMANLTKAQPEEIALFEQLTSDADYCRAKLEVMLDEDLGPFDFVIRGELDNKFNQHAAVAQSAEDIYERWPRPYRDCFQEYATRIGLVGVRDVYRHFGYDVAPMLVA